MGGCEYCLDDEFLFDEVFLEPTSNSIADSECAIGVSLLIADRDDLTVNLCLGGCEVEKILKIKYCPMCGKRLRREER